MIYFFVLCRWCGRVGFWEWFRTHFCWTAILLWFWGQHFGLHITASSGSAPMWPFLRCWHQMPGFVVACFVTKNTLAWFDACGQSLYAEFQSGSLVFLRLSTLNLTAIKTHVHYSRFTRNILLQLIRLSVRIVVPKHFVYCTVVCDCICMQTNKWYNYAVCLLLIFLIFVLFRFANLQLFCPLGMLLPEKVQSIQIANLSPRKLFCHQCYVWFGYQYHMHQDNAWQ